MSKPPRPTLDSLTSRFARKEPLAGATPSPEADASSSAPSLAAGLASAPGAEADPDAPRRPDARVQILTRIDAPTRKRLRMIAIEQDRTVQDICEEAIRDFVARHSK